MIRDELSRALETLGDRLPDGDVVVLVRRAFGDRSVSFIRGDVEAVTGYPASVFQVPTDRWIEIVHPQDRRSLRERLERVTTVEETRLEYRVVDPEGGVRWIRERLSVRRMSPQAPPEVVGVLRDITFERTIQARLAGLEKELWRSRKLEAVGTMASGVAHDFNNLLTVILASADLLRHDRSLSAESMDDVMVVREAANRGAELVRQILRFIAERPGRVGAVDLGKLVDDLEAILLKAVGKRIRVSLTLPQECWSVQADRTHLEQILLNLTSNAADAMPGGGALLIQVDNVEVDERMEVEGGYLSAGRYVRLTVRDSGMGMNSEVQARVFEPFFSTKGAGEQRPGGFGLSTVLRLVRGYGGGVGVESREGGGSAFHVYLPAREGDARLVREEWAGGSIAPPESDRGRILVVDADPSVREAVRGMLERDGHTVTVAGSVAEGLQAFDRVRPPFDLLLTDVVLPDRSGSDLWRAAARRVTDLPVIFMTAYDRETMAREGVAPSEARVLSKPLDPDALRKEVLRVLAGGGFPDSSDISGTSEG